MSETASDAGADSLIGLSQSGYDNTTSRAVLTHSDYSDDGEDADSCRSLREAERNSIWENGRSYHFFKAGSYPFPDDEDEQDRLDRQHCLFALTVKKLFSAPITDLTRVQRVLDVGTGTGIWAIEFADENPQAVVYGVDLSPIQPRWVPSNCIFQVDDLEQPWTFRDPFNFIHCRMGFTSLRQQGNFCRRAAKHLTPGGYLELTSIQFPMRWETEPPLSIQIWTTYMLEAIAKAGYKAEDARISMEHAGLVNVTKEVHVWPLNRGQKGWKDKEGQKIAAFSFETMCKPKALRSFSLALLVRVLGLQPAYVDTLLAIVGDDMTCRKHQATWEISTVYGQKPEEQSG